MCRDIYYIAALKICLPHYLHVAFSYTSQRSHTPQYFLIYINKILFSSANSDTK